MPTLTQLRTKHPRFIYQSYQYQLQDQNLELSWQFKLEPDITFQPQVIIHQVDAARFQELVTNYRPVLENLIFHLGMIEIPSYWKAACSPLIEIRAGELSTQQLDDWHDLLIKGQGEFFYLNQIDFTAPDFVTLINKPSLSSEKPAHTIDSTDSTDTNTAIQPQLSTSARPAKILLPLGGGKDSVVSLELLKNSAYQSQLTLFGLNPIVATQKIFKLNPQIPHLTAERIIDPKLLTLNQQGYLNGHTPFSAYMAFLLTLVGFIFEQDLILVSNEQSANEANTRYLNRDINHQYSKSFDFEQKFRSYSHRYLEPTQTNSPHAVKHASTWPEYLSLLRPLTELQIAAIFAQVGQPYFSIFRSCNRGQKTNTWCHQCPKCLFAFLMLFPFIDQEILTQQIFNHNLFADPNLIDEAINLVKVDSVKPFECVGSREESLIAFNLAISKYRAQGQTLPPVLAAIEQLNIESPLVSDTKSPAPLKKWHDQHFLPPELEELLKSALNHYI